MTVDAVLVIMYKEYVIGMLLFPFSDVLMISRFKVSVSTTTLHRK